jgi:hypothetical protein
MASTRFPGNLEGQVSMSSAGRQANPTDPIKMFLATLIALSSIMGAIFAWRASSASGGAAGADEAALLAVTNSLEISNLTKTEVYQHMQGYVRYLANRGLSESLADEASRKFSEMIANNGGFADPQAEAQIQLLQELLAARGQEALDRAAMSQYFLNPDYLQQDGTYDSTRESGEAQAEASRYRDVDPAPHFARADRLRSKTGNLLLVLLVLAVAVWCFVLAQALPKPAQFAALGIGVLVLLAGAGAGAYIEFLT